MSLDLYQIADLIEHAKRASDYAYCPYSNFRVGAAVKCPGDSDVFRGCNIENASYGLTNCAERNAIGQMVARGRRKIEAIAIYTPTATTTAPCGACRQVIHEFGTDALVIDACDGGVRLQNMRDLLPDSFGPDSLAGEIL